MLCELTYEMVFRRYQRKKEYQLKRSQYLLRRSEHVLPLSTFGSETLTADYKETRVTLVGYLMTMVDQDVDF
jgi:hypothetical protein